MKLHEVTNKRLEKIIFDFTDWIKNKINLSADPQIKLTSESNKVEAKRTFGTTSSDNKVWVYVGQRNTADILRTLAHELVHVKQFEDNMASNNMSDEQKQRIEDVANAMAGRLLREYGKQHIEIYDL